MQWLRLLKRQQKLAVLILVLASSLAIPAVSPCAAQEEENLYESLAIFSDILNKIRTEYVEPVDSEELIQEGIKGMLSALDPHTQYLDAEQYRYLMQGTHGSFGGLGIEIAVRGGVLTVVSPLEGTPAYRMGIQGGDRIIEIEGESTEGITSADAVKKLRGPRGSQVTITIRREGVPNPMEFTITRDIIKIESVPYAFMLDDDVAFIRVSSFADNTADELREKLEALEKENPRGIVIDLRSNPGGLLSTAVAVADLFVDRGELIVSTRGRRRSQNREYLARSDETHNNYPLMVLVNGASASASEIVAGAIQDWDLGLVVGTRTFGKGSVQSVVPLKHGGGALKITTAKYFTPSGRSIHRDDLDGRILLSHREEEAEAEGEAEGEEGSSELTPVTETPSSDAPSYRTSMGREVLGGGGIQPDIIIEPVFRSEVAQELERRTLFFRFVIKWLAAPENQDLTEVPSPEATPYDDFLTFLGEEEEKVEFTPEQLEENRDYIVRALRREIALKLIGHEEAARIAVEGDIQLMEAIKLFDEAPDLAALFALADKRAAEASAMAEEPEEQE